MDKPKVNIPSSDSSGPDTLLKQYQQLVEAAGDVMYTCDWQGYCTYVNGAVKRLFGYDPKDVIGHYFTDYIHPDWRIDVQAFYMQQYQDRTPETVHEFPALTQAGEVKWVEQIVILQTEGDRVTGFLGVVRDITRRKQAEDRLRAIIDAVPDHIYVKDRNHRFTLVNGATWQNEGFNSADDMLGLTDRDLYGDDGQDDWEAEERLFNTGKEIINYERENPNPSQPGKREVVIINKVPLYDENGKIAGLIGINRDITERKRATEQIRQSEQRYRAVVENQSDMISRTRLDMTITFANDAYCRFFGKSREELIGQSCLILTPEEEHAAFLERVQLWIEKPGIYTNEHPYQLPNGEMRWVEWTDQAILNDQGEVVEFQSSGRDVTRRRLAEDALIASEANLAALMNNTSDSIFSVDRDLRLIAYNATLAKRFEMNFGAALQPGVDFGRLVSSDMRDKWRGWINRALQGEHFSVEDTYRSGDTTRYIDVNLNPIVTPNGEITGAAVFSRDVTERKQAEAALQASEANLSAVMNNSTDSIFSGDRDMRILTLNRVFKQRYKILFNANIEVGMRLPDTVSPEVTATWEPHYRRALAGESFTVQQQWKTQDHSFYFDITYDPIFSGDEVTGVAVFSRDITARVVAEAALQESEQRYRAVVNNQSDLIFRFLPDTTLTFVNEAFCRFFDKGQQEVIGRGFLTVMHIPNEYHDVIRQQITQAAANGSPVVHELPLLDAKGDLHWQEWTDSAIRDEHGTMVELQTSARDVTARKEAEEALRESEQRYRAVVEEQSDLVSRSTLETTLTFVNDAYCRYFDKSREELIGRSFLILVPEEYHAEIRAKYADTVKNPAIRSEERRYYALNGELHWLEWTNTPIVDDRGNVVEIQSTGRDITERKRAEAERNEYIERLEILERLDTELSQTLKLDYVLDVALDAAVRMSGAQAGAIHLVEEDGRMRVAQVIGDYPRTMLGTLVEADQGIVGRVARAQQAELVSDVTVDPDYLANVPNIRAQITVPLISQERLIGTLNVQTAESRRFTEPIFDFVKLLSARIASALDNARLYHILRKQYDELQNVYEHVSGLEQLKSQIIRIAAHDLRNPLGVISGYLQVIEYDPDLQLPDKTREQLRTIAESAERIDKISRDILTLERIQSSQRGINLEPVDLAEMVRMGYNEHIPQAEMKKQDFQVKTPPRTITVEADPILLRETVNNLISNAIKYTPDCGKVVVRLKVEGENVIFEVEDNGYGIPEENQAELFKPFYRVKLKETREIKGTGLGLSLVKSIIERHNGQIRFYSQYGKGSMFGFQLPLPPKRKKAKSKG